MNTPITYPVSLLLNDSADATEATAVMLALAANPGYVVAEVRWLAVARASLGGMGGQWVDLEVDLA